MCYMPQFNLLNKEEEKEKKNGQSGEGYRWRVFYQRGQAYLILYYE